MEVVALKQPQRKIAIFGTTPSRMQGPYQDDSGWERWTIGPGGKDAHNWDRLLECHTVWPLNFGELRDDKSYLDDLSKEERPVYTIVPMKQAMEKWAAGHGKDEAWLKQNVRGDWKSNVVIDREALYEKHGRLWFQSSIDYWLCMAIEEGATEMGCWGIDLESGEEYLSQYISARHWLDIARTFCGIPVQLPPGCGLDREITPYPNRYETHLALVMEKKDAHLNGIIERQTAEYEGLRTEVSRAEGAFLALKQISENPNHKPDDLKAMMADFEKRMHDMNHHLQAATANLNHMKGEKSATEYYRRMYTCGMVDPT